MIKLTTLLKETVDPSDIVDPKENLLFFLENIFNGIKNHRGNHKFDIKSINETSFDVVVDGKVNIHAEYKLTANNKIKGWTLTYKSWSTFVDYSSMRGMNISPEWAMTVRDTIDGAEDTVSDPDDGKDIQMNDIDAQKILDVIKKIIDVHPFDYEMTDASNTYSKGTKSVENIRKLYSKLPTKYRNETFEYWNTKAPSMYKYKTFDEFNRHFNI